MVRWRSNGLYGNKPHWYRKDRSRRLTEEVWVKQYEEMSPDPWELCEDAYSLHPTRHEAMKFKSPFSFYVNCTEPELVYVSPSTLEDIMNSEKHVIIETSD